MTTRTPYRRDLPSGVGLPHALPSCPVLMHGCPREPFGQIGIRQFLVPGFALICLLLGVACTFMWARSQHLWDSFTHIRPGQWVQIDSYRGHAVLRLLDVEATTQADDQVGITFGSAPLRERLDDGGHVDLSRPIAAGDTLASVKWLPGWLQFHWMLAAGVALVWPVAYLIRAVQRTAYPLR
jgi:hypothetical protein